MSNQVTSQVLGSLTQVTRLANWWISTAFEIPFFDKRAMRIIFADFEPDEDATFLQEADEALTNFFTLNAEDRNAISNLAYDNCIAFLDAVDVDEVDQSVREIKDKNEIWKYIHPSEFYVTRRPYQEQDIYIQIACDCDWEQEHGLQLVFRQGKKLTRISEQDGHLTEADAYGKPDEEDALLAKF